MVLQVYWFGSVPRNPGHLSKYSLRILNTIIKGKRHMLAEDNHHLPPAPRQRRSSHGASTTQPAMDTSCSPEWDRSLSPSFLISLFVFFKSCGIFLSRWRLHVNKKRPRTEACPFPSEPNCSPDFSYFIHLLQGCALGDDQLPFIFNKPIQRPGISFRYCSIAVKKHHGQSNFCKRKHLTRALLPVSED